MSKRATTSGKSLHDAKKSDSGDRKRRPGREEINEGTLYAKIVEGSEEDQCFVSSAPGLVYGGCHGPDERKVIDLLCQIVDEIVDFYHKEEGKRLPSPSAGRDLANSLEQIA